MRPPVRVAPDSGSIVRDLVAAAGHLERVAAGRVAWALERGCALERGPFLRVRGSVAILAAEGPALARRIAAFQERPGQDAWQLLGNRMRTWAGRMREALRKLDPESGPPHRNAFGLVLRRMDPRDFVYQDVRSVRAEVDAADWMGLRRAALAQGGSAEALLERLDGLRDRCEWGG